MADFAALASHLSLAYLCRFHVHASICVTPLLVSLLAVTPVLELELLPAGTGAHCCFAFRIVAVVSCASFCAAKASELRAPSDLAARAFVYVELLMVTSVPMP